MFLPTTKKEMARLGWPDLHIILISGDTYIDSPYSGVAVIGKTLVREGFRVGIIPQPQVTSDEITRLGEPTLFWGITGGTVDSMVANYTASKKWRKSDDFTPGGVNNRRPDRAVIAYANLIRRHFKHTRPIVLGGIEASLRRISHFDFWSNKIRRSILADAKADYLLYGMAEAGVTALARALKEERDPRDIPGLCYLSKDVPSGYLLLPSFEETAGDKKIFTQSFNIFYRNNDPKTAQGLAQKQDTRWLIQNPPPETPTRDEMDQIFDLEFERDVHPLCKKAGEVKALTTIQFSIPTHRGCYGECNFCAIAVHEGRTVAWRSEASILKEAQAITRHGDFKGIIGDVGGPTANMYGFECSKKLKKGVCHDRRCLFPEICPSLKPDHSFQIRLLRKIRNLPGVRKVFVSSGIRYDLIQEDGKKGNAYLKEVTDHHVSGQMKVAPEHTQPRVLALMGKPGIEALAQFKKRFDNFSRQAGKPQFLTYYLIAAHPGCTMKDMEALKRYTREELGTRPEQIQIFTPTPSTFSTLMYATGIDPFSGAPIFVERDRAKKERQKQLVTGSNSQNRFKKKHPEKIAPKKQTGKGAPKKRKKRS